MSKVEANLDGLIYLDEANEIKIINSILSDLILSKGGGKNEILKYLRYWLFYTFFFKELFIVKMERI